MWIGNGCLAFMKNGVICYVCMYVLNCNMMNSAIMMDRLVMDTVFGGLTLSNETVCCW